MMPAISEEPDIKTESDTDTLYNASSYFASSPSSNYDVSDRQQLLRYASDLEEGLMFLRLVFPQIFRKFIPSSTDTLAFRLFNRWYTSKESIITGPWMRSESGNYALQNLLASVSATCNVEIPVPVQKHCDVAIDKSANVRELFRQAENARVQCRKAYESITQYGIMQCSRKGLCDPFTCTVDNSFMHFDCNSELYFVSNLGNLDALGSFVCKDLPYGTKTGIEITLKQAEMKRINQDMEYLETASRALSAEKWYFDPEFRNLQIDKQREMQKLDRSVLAIQKLFVDRILEGDSGKLEEFEVTFNLRMENYPWITI